MANIYSKRKTTAKAIDNTEIKNAICGNKKYAFYLQSFDFT